MSLAWRCLDQPVAPGRGEGFEALLGQARSGTTVLARALVSHQEIGYWQEPALLARVEVEVCYLDALVEHPLADPATSPPTFGSFRTARGDAP